MNGRIASTIPFPYGTFRPCPSTAWATCRNPAKCYLCFSSSSFRPMRRSPTSVWMVAGEACGQPDGMLVKRPCSVGARSAPEDKGAERSERRIPRALRARNVKPSMR